MGATGDTRINTYECLIGKHKGGRAFICGSGPSLYDAIVSYCWRDIFNDVVIAVNSSILAMPWQGQKLNGYNIDPDRCYWMSNDALCRRWSWWQTVKQSNCIKVVRDSWLKYKDEIEGFLIFSPRPTPEDIINPEDKGLAYCSSVPSAIDMAIQMGCEFIYLLGVDNGFEGTYTHFWQLWDKKDQPVPSSPAQGPREQQEKVFEINKVAYKALSGFAQKNHAGIINCSPLSHLKEFWKMDFCGLMNIIKGDDKKCLS